MFFIKEGKFFPPYLRRSTRSWTSIVSQLEIQTKFGLFIPLTDSATNLINYFEHGEKALFSGDRVLNGFLLGSEHKLHWIRAVKDETIEVTVATYVLRTEEECKDFKFIVSTSESEEELLNGFIFGDYKLSSFFKAYDSLGNFAGNEAFMPPNWKKGRDLWKVLEAQNEIAAHLVNPDYKEKTNES